MLGSMLGVMTRRAPVGEPQQEAERQLLAMRLHEIQQRLRRLALCLPQYLFIWLVAIRSITAIRLRSWLPLCF